jgi:hypothetical protein
VIVGLRRLIHIQLYIYIYIHVDSKEMFKRYYQPDKEGFSDFFLVHLGLKQLSYLVFRTLFVFGWNLWLAFQKTSGSPQWTLIALL